MSPNFKRLACLRACVCVYASSKWLGEIIAQLGRFAWAQLIDLQANEMAQTSPCSCSVCLLADESWKRTRDGRSLGRELLSLMERDALVAHKLGRASRASFASEVGQQSTVPTSKLNGDDWAKLLLNLGAATSKPNGQIMRAGAKSLLL